MLFVLAPAALFLAVLSDSRTAKAPKAPEDKMGGVMSSVGKVIGRGAVEIVKLPVKLVVGVGKGVGQGVSDLATTSPDEEKRKLRHQERKAEKKAGDDAKKVELRAAHEDWEMQMQTPEGTPGGYDGPGQQEEA